jgi:hypothetical protein
VPRTRARVGATGEICDGERVSCSGRIGVHDVRGDTRRRAAREHERPVEAERDDDLRNAERNQRLELCVADDRARLLFRELQDRDVAEQVAVEVPVEHEWADRGYAHEALSVEQDAPSARESSERRGVEVAAEERRDVQPLDRSEDVRRRLALVPRLAECVDQHRPDPALVVRHGEAGRLAA